MYSIDCQRVSRYIFAANFNIPGDGSHFSSVNDFISWLTASDTIGIRINAYQDKGWLQTLIPKIQGRSLATIGFGHPAPGVQPRKPA